MKRKEKDSFLKARIIISSILLAVILGGWLIYGIHATYSNPRLVLQKFLKSEEKNIYDKISNFKVDNTSNKKININNDKDIYYYHSLDDNSIYFYNDTHYFDLINYYKVKDITINNKELMNKDNYKVIVKSIRNGILKNIKLFDIDNKKDKEKGLYLYTYSLTSLEPLIKSLSTDKELTNTLDKMFGDSNRVLDNLKDKAFGISILTKGSKRERVYYSFNIENVVNIKIKEDTMDGYIGNYGFIIEDNKITISDENGNYDIEISDDDNFNIDKLEETAFDNVLSLN